MKALTYADIGLDYCSNTFGLGSCSALLGYEANADALPIGFYFAGATPSYLNKASGLTGAADGKLLTFSFWIMLNGYLDCAIIDGTGDVGVSLDASGKVQVLAKDTGGTVNLLVLSSAIPVDGRWHHVMGSFDLSNTAKRHLYVDGVSDLATVTTYTNSNIDFTLAAWRIGHNVAGTKAFEGKLAEIWFAPGVYIDLSVEANRDKFMTRPGSFRRPVYLGATGQLPTGTAPLIYFADTSFTTLTDNKGTGGAFTNSGAIQATFATNHEPCYNTKTTCGILTSYNLRTWPTDLGSYVGSVEASGIAATNHTFEDVALGAVPDGDETRTSVIIVTAYASATQPDLTSAYIGDELAVIQVEQRGSDNTSVAIITADLDSLTADVDLVYAAAVDEIAIEVYRLIDVTPSTTYVNSASGNSPSLTRNFVAEPCDVVVSGAGSSLLGAHSWTGVTADVSDVVTNLRYSSAHHDFPEGSKGFTIATSAPNSALSAPTIAYSAALSSNRVQVSSGNLAAQDVIVAIFEDDNRGGDLALSGWDYVGTGKWTNNADSTNSGRTRIHVLWKRVSNNTAIDDLLTYSDSTNLDHVSGIVLVVRGVKAGMSESDIFKQVASGNNGATADTSGISPTLTTTIKNSLILDIISRANDSGSTTSFSGWTNANLTGLAEVVEAGTSNNNGGGVGVAAGVMASAGATGTTTATLAASTFWQAVKIAIAPTNNSEQVLLRASMIFKWSKRREHSTVAIRVAKDTGFNPDEIDALPLLESIQHTPTIVSLGESLGTRESVTLVLNDAPHPDNGVGFDKYWRERDYDPLEQGTLWAKFAARQRYIRGNVLTWYQGELGQSLDQMTARQYIIDSVNGPNTQGQLTIIAKDPLKLIDNDKAVAPTPCDGTLSANMTAVDTTFTLLPSGIGNQQYAISGYVSVGGNEVMSFTRSGDVFTVVRGQLGTTAVAHNIEDRVQQGLYFTSKDAATIIRTLMVKYGDVRRSWVPTDDWLNEVDNYLRRLYGAYIGEPTSVRKLITELIQICGLAIWWESSLSLIKLVVLRSITPEADEIDATVRMDDAPAITDQPDKRVSQLLVYYGIIDPLKKLDDTNNYRSIARQIDAESESNYETSAIKSIFCRWVPQYARTTAFRVAEIWLSRFAIAPRRFSFKVFRLAQLTPTIATSYYLRARNLQDESGAEVRIPFQPFKIGVSDTQYMVEGEEMRLDLSDEDLTNRVITIDGPYNVDMNLRTLHDTIYPAIRDGDTVSFIFGATAVVTSSKGTIPAINVGTWPVGIVPYIEMRGKAYGAGGDGGMGATGATDSNATAGSAGAAALYTRTAITLRYTGGTLSGGGGGGGGGACRKANDHRGGGGGGGAGRVPGKGGLGPGKGYEGADGTDLVGGLGGDGWTQPSALFYPDRYHGIRGGDGGVPGSPGTQGTGTSELARGAGGPAGKSIDGISYVTVLGTPGTLVGPTGG